MGAGWYPLNGGSVASQTRASGLGVFLPDERLDALIGSKILTELIVIVSVYPQPPKLAAEHEHCCI